MKSRTVVIAVGLAFCVCAAITASGVTPPANGYKSSITKPTSPTGTDWAITKASQAQVKVSSGSVTFSVKVNGVIDTVTTTPVTQSSNTFEIQFRVPNGSGGSTTRTVDFPFALTAGKTTGTVKNPVALSATAVWGKVLDPDESIEIRAISLIQGGSGGGSGNVFGVAGLTAK